MPPERMREQENLIHDLTPHLSPPKNCASYTRPSLVTHSTIAFGIKADVRGALQTADIGV